MDNIWMVRMTVAPYTDRNNIEKLWFKVVSQNQMTAARMAIDKVSEQRATYRLYNLTVDHQPHEHGQGVLDWGEEK